MARLVDCPWLPSLQQSYASGADNDVKIRTRCAKPASPGQGQLIVPGIIHPGSPARIDDDGGEGLLDDGGPGDCVPWLEISPLIDRDLLVATPEIGAACHRGLGHSGPRTETLRNTR